MRDSAPTHSLIRVRVETAADYPGIDAVNKSAFGGDEEVALVRGLREADLVIASLVAIAGETVVGHVMLSRLPLDAPGAPIVAASLAPLAVEPARQGHGIGSMLVREGLNRCRAEAIDLVVVLGHAEYYPRFGFSAALARRLQAPFRGDAFMALALTAGVLDGRTAAVRYPAAFGLDDR